MNFLFTKIKNIFKYFFSGDWLDRPRSVWMVALIVSSLCFIFVFYFVLDLAIEIHSPKIRDHGRATLPAIEGFDQKEYETLFSEYGKRANISANTFKNVTLPTDPSLSQGSSSVQSSLKNSQNSTTKSNPKFEN